MAENIERELPDFDPDYFPDNPQNVAAAEARSLTYMPGAGAYVDCDGCLIRDRFGQPF